MPRTQTRAQFSAAARRAARRRQREVRSVTPMQQFLNARASGVASRTKIPINETTAMQVAAVFSSVRILAGIRATLPLKVYQRADDGREMEVRLHPIRDLLCDGGRPNPYQVPAALQAQRQSHLALWGNSYCELTFDIDDPARVAVKYLIAHHPTAVTPFIDDRDLDRDGFPRLKYSVRDASGGTRTVPASAMLHNAGLGYDGVEGRSMISLAAESMGVAKAQDNLCATFYGNANRPFLIVSTPDYLDDIPHARLSREISEEYSGDNAFGSILLEGGATASTLTMTFEDAQLLQSKNLTSREIASGFFGLPPHLSGDLENAHFDNLDEQDRALVTYTLAPLLVRDEQEMGIKLFSHADRRDGLYVRYNVDALLRGQQKVRYEAHKSALISGWRTINEVRAVEDLQPLPGGDELARPQAIYGKPATPAANPEGGRPPESRSDHRDQLRALISQVLDGLQRHEEIQLTRLAGRADFESRAREFYGAHARKAADRLAAIPGAADRLADHFASRANEVARAAADPRPDDAVRLCVSNWSDDPQRLADLLTGDNTK